VSNLSANTTIQVSVVTNDPVNFAPWDMISGGTAPYTVHIQQSLVWTFGEFFWFGANTIRFIPSGAITEPTTKLANFNIEVRDSVGASVYAAILINFYSPGLSILGSPFEAVAGYFDYPYEKTLLAAGGVLPYTWSCVGLPTGISLLGNVLSGTFVERGAWSSNITVQDVEGMSVSTGLNFTVVTHPSELPPGPIAQLVIAQQTDLAVLTGSNVSISIACSGGVAPFNWSATSLPAGLTLSSSSTNLVSISGICTESSGVTKNVNVVVTDSATPTASTDSMTFKIIVGSAYSAISITPRSLSPIGVNSNFSQTFSVTGSTNPIRWSATQSVPGLTFNTAAGTLSGKPTTAGNYNIVINATDDFMVPISSDTATMTLRVFKIQMTAFLSGTVPVTIDTNYSSYDAFQATGSVDGNYVWTAVGLPTGLTIAAKPSDKSIGVISGKIPLGTAPKVYRVTVGVAATGGVSSDFRSFDLSAIMPEGSPLIAYNDEVTTKFETAVKINVLINDTGTGIYIAGSTKPANGTLTLTEDSSIVPPSNVSLFTLFQYVPNKGFSGTDSFTYTIKDSAHASAQGTVTVIVSEPEDLDGPVINNLPTSPVVLDIEDDYDYSFTALGGITPLIWSATGLPIGLTMSVDGAIAGTVTRSGAYAATITVTDSQITPKSDSKPLAFTVADVLPVISNLPASPVALDMGSAYEYAFTATGGIGALTWSATSLPTGLSMATDGVLSGTPTVAGDYNATIIVTDSQLSPKSDSKPLTFSVVNVYTAVIQGTLRLDTSNGVFAARRVYLYNYTTGDKVAATTSDGTTGEWEFTAVAPGEYFVVGAAQGDDLNIPRDFDALGVITVV
jgi:hypothetical protein